jgi:hypothetical protein
VCGAWKSCFDPAAEVGMALFTTTLGLYGGVLWGGELQGFIIHAMMPAFIAFAFFASAAPASLPLPHPLFGAVWCSNKARLAFGGAFFPGC